MATGSPVITGTAQVGESLSVDLTGVSDADTIITSTLTYLWYANDGADDTAIEGATGSTYTPVADDEGKTITVQVIFNDGFGYNEVVTSAPTAAVTAAAENTDRDARTETVGGGTEKVESNTPATLGLVQAVLDPGFAQEGVDDEQGSVGVLFAIQKRRRRDQPDDGVLRLVQAVLDPGFAHEGVDEAQGSRSGCVVAHCPSEALDQGAFNLVQAVLNPGLAHQGVDDSQASGSVFVVTHIAHEAPDDETLVLVQAVTGPGRAHEGVEEPQGADGGSGFVSMLRVTWRRRNVLDALDDEDLGLVQAVPGPGFAQQVVDEAPGSGGFCVVCKPRPRESE